MSIYIEREKMMKGKKREEENKRQRETH